MSCNRFASCLLLGTFLFIAGCRDESLTSQQIYTLTDGEAKGPVSFSPNGRLVAFSNGENIFTIDLDHLDADPIQRTNTHTAFAPSFLSDGRIVFGTISKARPSEIQFLTLESGTVLNVPQARTFRTVTAADLGFANDAVIVAPTVLQLNQNGTIATGVINDNPFLFDFGSDTIQVTSINVVFNEPISTPAISPDQSQFAFTNSSGNIGVTTISNGVIETQNTTILGPGSFPSFTQANQLTFFDGSGMVFDNGTGFSRFVINPPSFTPGFPAFTPDGFVTLNENSFFQNTLSMSSFGFVGF